MYDFKDKIIAITGAAQGLGACMVKRFLQEGAKGVAMIDLKQDMLESKRAELDPSGMRTLGVICDVADEDAVAVAFEQIFKQFGKVDILVNNAGITRDAMAHKMSASKFDQVLKVSLNGAFYCTQQVMEGMRSRQWGRIISMSSIAARGNIGQVNYAAAKAGIVGFTKTLAFELGSKNITVNCIAPGMINTEIIQTVPQDQIEAYKKGVPLRRLGEPEEVANLAVFLASDEAAYISGQCIKITGGMQ